jgi:predicted ArsR family transcriptional regulator
MLDKMTKSMATSSEDQLLYLLKSRGALTAADAGAAMGITPQGAHQWLSKMAAAGLAAAEDRHQGRGRPKRFWRLTKKGHARFPDRHSDLTLEILRSVEALFGEEGLDRLIGHREAASLAAYLEELKDCTTLEQRVEALAAMRSREGYMARWERRGRDEFLLIEDHCPICAAAQHCQNLCRAELSVFEAALGPGATVRRTDHLLSGGRRCAYRIAPTGKPP